MRRFDYVLYCCGPLEVGDPDCSIALPQMRKQLRHDFRPTLYMQQAPVRQLSEQSRRPWRLAESVSLPCLPVPQVRPEPQARGRPLSKSL